MPVVTYESLILLDPTKVSSDAEGVKNQIHHILERHGAVILVSRPWDYNHKLAYPIAKQKKGAFHIVYYTLDSSKQKEVERDFALQEGLILRQLTLKVNPKWQDIILGVAREDTANGFAVRGMRDEVAASSDPLSIGSYAEGVPAGLDDAAPPREREGRSSRGRRGEAADKPE
jgi:small subunit ribosomal protein S6